MEFPTPYELDFAIPGKPVTDRFGNERPAGFAWQKLPVSTWWIGSTEEQAGDSILRTVDMLHVHVPASTSLDAAAKVRLPDGSEWSIEGNSENYEHGWHGWSPGLLVIHAKKVEG